MFGPKDVVFCSLAVVVGIVIGISLVTLPIIPGVLNDSAAIGSLLGAFFAALVGLFGAVGMAIYDRVQREEARKSTQLGVVIAAQVAVLPFIGYFSSLSRENAEGISGLEEVGLGDPRRQPPEFRVLVSYIPELARLDPQIAHQINCMINAFRLTLPSSGHDQKWVLRGAESGAQFAGELRTLLSSYERSLKKISK